MAETIKGLNIKLGLDATELNEKLGKVKTDLKEQQADLKAINAKLKYDSSNVDAWKEKQAKLNQILESTKAKLELQNQKLEEAKKAVQIGALSEAEFKKMERSVQYTEADVAKLNTELDLTNKKIASLSAVNWSGISKIGTNLTRYVTTPVIAASTALGTLAYKSMFTIDEIADNAQKVYLTAEAYQEWAYAAEILAVDQAQLQKAFVKVNALLGDIASGDIDTVNEKLKLIGLTSEDLIGLSTDEAFTKIRDALAKVGDEASRTAVANEIFGDKLGSELTQILSATSEQVNDLRNECRELGVVSNEDAQLAGEFTDSISRLKQALKSLQNEIAQALLPVLNKLVELMTKKIIPGLKTIIDKWNNLSSGVKKAIGIFAGLVVALGPVLSIIGKVVPLITSAVKAFTAAKGAITVAGVAIKGSTLGWGALIAVIAVILLQNERFRELLKEIVDILGSVLSRLVGLVQEIISSLMPIIEQLMVLINEVIDVLVDLLEKKPSRH